MTDELREHQARKELSVEAAAWCIVGMLVLILVVSIIGIFRL